MVQKYVHVVKRFLKMENSSKLTKQIIIACCVMGLLLALDIGTKLGVYFALGGVDGANVEVIPNFFWIYLTFNKGAAFSFLANAAAGRIILSILSILGSGISIYYLVKNFKTLNIYYRIALYLFIPGCTGNLIDRVGIYQTPGVIDFLRFRLFNSYDFPVFNVADSCLTISIIVFIIAFIVTDNDKKKENKSNEEVSSK